MAEVLDELRLPPTPPPSPPTTRRRNKTKKSADPFLDLGPSTVSPLAELEDECAREGKKESLLTRILLTPLLSTSFLLSLFLINRADLSRRTSNNPPSSSSLLTYLSPRSYFHPPEPYQQQPLQDPDSQTWQRRNSTTHVEPHSALHPPQKGESWYLHKKIRKIAWLEIGDAFEIRGRVMGVLVVLVVAGFLGCVLGVRLLLGWVWWG